MPSIASSLSPNLSLKRTVRKPSVRSSGGIVVTQNRVASEIGARVLKEGGHAVDAAVAAAFAVGVVEPWMSGIGGVGAMLVREAKTGKITAVDFGGRSPKGLKIEDFPLAGGQDEGNLFGWPLVKDNRNTVGRQGAGGTDRACRHGAGAQDVRHQAVAGARGAGRRAGRAGTSRRLAYDAGHRQRTRAIC